MSAISIDMQSLNARASALRTAGESFTPLQLNAIDTISTISAIGNSITAHETSSQVHSSVGKYLILSATLITDIGQGFFEIDQDAAAMMAL